MFDAIKDFAFGKYSNSLEITSSTDRKPSINGKDFVLLKLNITKVPPTRVRVKNVQIEVFFNGEQQSELSAELSNKLFICLGEIVPDNNGDNIKQDAYLSPGDKASFEFYIQCSQTDVVSFSVRLFCEQALINVTDHFGKPQWVTSAVSLPIAAVGRTG